MAQNTIDEDQLQALQSKSRINDLVFKRLKAQHSKGLVMAKEEKKVAKATKEVKDTKATAKATPAKESKAAPAKSAEAEFKYGVSDLAKNGLKVHLCDITFQRNNLDKGKVRDAPFVSFVPSGVATVAVLQSKGFAYLKVG